MHGDRQDVPCSEEPDLWYTEEFEHRVLARGEKKTEAEKQALSEYRERETERSLKAKLICLKECSVQEECLALGLDEEFGIWGSYDEHERALIAAGKAGRQHYIKPNVRGNVAYGAKTVDLFIAGMSIAELQVMLGTSRNTILDQLRTVVQRLSERMTDGGGTTAIAS